MLAGAISDVRGLPMSRCFRLLAPAIAYLLLVLPAAADKRVALVVGNSAYVQAAPLTADGAAAELNLSRATYYRRREQAIQQLATAFVRQINPALRLDRPPRPDRLIGRDEVRESCRRALQAKRSVGLSGPAGIGKTTLGAAVVTAEPFAARRVFWYTFIPGLNDQLGSVLFSLGLFLWQQGAANLWAQLIAEPGRINPALLLGLLREDLKTLSETPPLLCFDEVDLLRPAEVEAHTQVVAFLGCKRLNQPSLAKPANQPAYEEKQNELDGVDFGIDLRGQTLRCRSNGVGCGLWSYGTCRHDGLADLRKHHQRIPIGGSLAHCSRFRIASLVSCDRGR